MINWKVRFKNKTWVTSFVSQLLIFLQILFALLNSLGITEFQLTDQIKNEILTLVNVFLVLLSMLGVVQDPTTKGFKDSERAMGYKEPN